MKRFAIFLLPFLIFVLRCGPGLYPSNSSDTGVDPSEPAGVSGVTPASGVRGLTISVSGSNFISGATVTVAGVACGNVVIASPRELTCDLGVGAPGVGDVVIANPGGVTTTLAGAFTYRMFLYVLETNRIKVYELDGEGIAQEIAAAQTSLSTGQTKLLSDPLGKYLFAFDSSGTANVFSINGNDGTLTAISGNPFILSVPVTSIVIAPTGAAIYASGTGVAISVVSVERASGALLVTGTAGPSNGNSPMYVTPDGKFLYAKKSIGGMTGFRIGATGGLESLGQVSTLSAQFGAIDNSSQLFIAVEAEVIRDILRIDSSSGSLTAIGDPPVSDALFSSPTHPFLYRVRSNAGFTYLVDAVAGTLTEVSGGAFDVTDSMKVENSGTFAVGHLTGGTGLKVYKVNQSTGKLSTSATLSGSPASFAVN